MVKKKKDFVDNELLYIKSTSDTRILWGLFERKTIVYKD